MFYSTDKNDHGLRYNPLKACVVPRPIGWISTVDAAGVTNLAPFSFFNLLSYDPPFVMFSAGVHETDGGKKDTVANVEGTGEFVYNMATWGQKDQMNETAWIIDRTVDETWIGDYLHLLSLDLVTTFYAGIKRLAPAHALTIGTAGPRTWRYWTLDPHRELRLPRESDYVEAFREKLELAVRRRTDTPFEVGAELSGGLDSAAICAIAQESLHNHGRDLQTFSQVLPEGTPERPG